MQIYRTNNPLEFDDVDGIIIDERAPAPRIQGANANTAILVGRFQRGPENELTEPGSIGRFLEIFGKSNYSGNLEIRNKRFSRLKIIRSVAADAAKATLTVDGKLKFDAKYKGAYGNNLKVTVENASLDTGTPGTSQVEKFDWDNEGVFGSDMDVNGPTITSTYIALASQLGVFWFNVTDGANTQTEPAVGGESNYVQVNVLSTDGPNEIATKLKAAIDGAGLGASVQSTAIIATGVLQVTYVPGAQSSDGYEFNDVSTIGATFTKTTSGVDGVAGVDAGVKITITDSNTDAVLSAEVYDNLKIAEITDATFGNSELVDVTVLDALSGEPAVQAITPLAGGTDGTIADLNYEASIAVAEQVGAGNVLWTDKYSATIKGYLKQHVLNAPDKMVIVSTDDPEDTLATALADVGSYRDTQGAIIYAFNGLQTRINGVNKWTSAAGWVASIFSNTAPHVSLAYQANVAWTAGASDVKHKLSRAEFIQLKEAGIAGFENDPDIGGFKLVSAITTQTLSSSKVTILRRRMAYYLTDSISKFLKNYQNAPNTLANRKEVAAAITAFDDGQINLGILPGNDEVQNGSARLIDTESLNTNNSIAAGFFKILYKRRIHSEMRYIVLQAEIGESVVVTEGE